MCGSSDMSSKSYLLTTQCPQIACLGAKVARLAILPTDIFVDDWSFTSINIVLAFICEILFSVMNLMAPSFPVFFDQTSTGGLHYIPCDDKSRKNQFSSFVLSKTASRVGKGQVTRAKADADGGGGENNDLVELTKMGNGTSFTSIRRQEDYGRTNFDSDAIPVRRSVEIR